MHTALIIGWFVLVVGVAIPVIVTGRDIALPQLEGRRPRLVGCAALAQGVALSPIVFDYQVVNPNVTLLLGLVGLAASFALYVWGGVPHIRRTPRTHEAVSEDSGRAVSTDQ